MIPLIDHDNKDPNYVINIYKTVWCPHTQEYLLSNLAMIEVTVPMPIIYKITGENHPNTNTNQRSVLTGIFPTKSSQLNCQNVQRECSVVCAMDGCSIAFTLKSSKIRQIIKILWRKKNTLKRNSQILKMEFRRNKVISKL